MRWEDSGQVTGIVVGSSENFSKGINLSPVTPIICIQLPVEVLGKRKTGKPEYTR